MKNLKFDQLRNVEEEVAKSVRFEMKSSRKNSCEIIPEDGLVNVDDLEAPSVTYAFGRSSTHKNSDL